MRMAGSPREEMRDKALKTDGSKPSLRAVDDVIAHFEEDHHEWQRQAARHFGMNCMFRYPVERVFAYNPELIIELCDFPR